MFLRDDKRLWFSKRRKVKFTESRLILEISL